jgi:signal transduction histidine kinase
MAQPHVVTPGETRVGLSLSARLVILVLASLLPMLTFNFGRQYLAYRESVEETYDRTLQDARRTAVAIEQTLNAHIAVIETLALSDSLRDRNMDGFRGQAEKVVARSHPGTNIVLLGENGHQFMNTIVPRGAQLPVRPYLVADRKTFATGQPVVSDFFVAAVSARPLITIDVPVKGADGQVESILSINPGMGVFAETIRREGFPETWVVSVFDSQGVNIVRTLRPERFVGQKAGAELLALMLAQREGQLDALSREGIRLVTAFSRLPGFDWTVAIGVPHEELTSPALAAAVRTLVVGGLLLIASLLLALYAARDIARPIASLRTLAALAGDPEVASGPPRTGLREADEVALALQAAQQKRRRSEEEKEQAQAALGSSEAKLLQSQKMEAIGNMTGGMAHDFNNLLGVIVGNLDLARPLVKDRPEVDELIGESLDAALSGADLTRRLLAFARRQPLQAALVRLNDVVGGMAKLLGRTLGENIEISLDPAPHVWPVLADPSQIEASLINLATNARDAMPNGGQLKIVTGNAHLDADYVQSRPEVSPGDYAMIEVSDTGVGMSAELTTRIFEPFFTTKERGSGTGLGLAMVFGFMRQSGGHITVHSKPGAGTTFRLYLPRAAVDSEGVEPASSPPLSGGAGETVLVVEDNAALRRVAVRQLRELGYRVLEAENAAAGLLTLEHERVDLIFSDVVMPGGMDGFALAKRVADRWPNIAIVLASGFSEATAHDRSATSVRLLSKPYRKSDIAHAIRQALDAGK